MERVKILSFVALTQYVMRYAVMMPLTQSAGVEMQISELTFAALVASSMCIAASICRQNTKTIHLIICATGLLTGGGIIWMIGVSSMITVYIMVALMVTFYFSFYRHQFLVGNIYVAIFSAMIPLPILLEIPLIYRIYGQNPALVSNLNFAIYIVIFLAVFIFLTALLCEFLRDTEDFENDNISDDCQSFPFVMGSPFVKQTIICINAALIIMICCLYFLLLRDITGWFSFLYLLFLIVIPILLVSWKVHFAETGDHYRRACNLMKMTLIAGVA